MTPRGEGDDTWEGEGYVQRGREGRDIKIVAGGELVWPGEGEGNRLWQREGDELRRYSGDHQIQSATALLVIYHSISI